MRMKISQILLFVMVCFTECPFCGCFNTTDKLWTTSEKDFHSKRARLLNFNAGDGNLRLDLQFTAPFIEIPLRKSMEMGKMALANVNIAGVIFSGITMLASALLLPTILLFFKNKFIDSFMYQSANQCENQSRGDNKNMSSSEMWRYMTILDNTLIENNVDVMSCLQRSLCATTRQSANNVRSGKGTSLEKLVDGIATNDWLLSLIPDTPLYSAIKTGGDGENCFDVYKKCQISQSSIIFFTKKVATLMDNVLKKLNFFST